MNRLKDLILKSKECVQKAERERVGALRKLTFRQGAKIAHALASDPWNRSYRWPKDDHPQSLSKSLTPKSRREKRK